MVSIVLRSWGSTVQAAVFFLALIFAWEIAVTQLQIKEYLLPPPSAVVRAAWDARWLLLEHTIITLNETILGFLGGIAFGVPTALAIFGIPLARRTLYPLMVALQSIPKAAMAPLLVVWFGYGMSSKVVMSFLIAFFPIIVGTFGGLQSTPSNLLEHFRALRASPWSTFWRLRLFSAMPSFIDGCKVAMPLAVIGAVIGEFVGSDSGLGNLILLSTSSQQTALTFAALGAVTILSSVLFAIVEAVGTLVWWRSR